MRILLVHNPGAGDGIHSRDSLAGLIREAGHTVEAFSSKDDRWHAALNAGIDLVTVAGGDGTVAEVARVVAGTGTPLAVLPFGTANNIACALRQDEIPIQEIVAGWVHAARQPFDLGIARGAWGTFAFVESVGAGLLAETMAEIEYGSAGHVNRIDDPEARIDAAMEVFERTLRRLPAVPFEIAVDGRDLSGEYVLVEALNFGAAGPNLHLAPHAEPGDGLLDIVLVDEDGRRHLLENFRLYREEPARAPRLPAVCGRQVSIRCGDVTLHLDDEIRRHRGGHEAIEVSLVPGALTFVVPARQQAQAC
jgi:diacylglycerol kinase family enzyme